jgi:hypothetical protein
MRSANLRERMDAVDHRGEAPSFGEHPQLLDVGGAFGGRPRDDASAAAQPVPRRAQDLRQCREDEQQPAAGSKYRGGAREGRGTDRVDHDVVGLTAAREVLVLAIDDALGTDRLHQPRARAAAHGGHPCAGMSRQLHGRAADGSGGAVDQHALAGAQRRTAIEVEHGRAAEGQGGRLLVGKGGRLACDRSVCGKAAILRMTTQLDAGEGKYRVVGPEPRDLRADRDDIAGKLAAEDRPARP